MNYFTQEVKKLYASLNLSKRIVGIVLAKDEKTFEESSVKVTKKPINYCGMVKAAAMGNSVKGKRGNFKCQSGPRVIGIDKSDKLNDRGQNWAKLGIYRDETISKKIRDELKYNKEDIYGVIVKPLEEFDRCPDVILIVANPYNCMRIVQGYAYNYGMPKEVNFIGNQAICLEGTVVPYVTQQLNISLMCIGTRHRAGWLDEEMVVGIPASKFSGTVEGIVKTINIMENDKNKKRIQENFAEAGLEDLEIEYGYNYYKKC